MKYKTKKFLKLAVIFLAGILVSSLFIGGVADSDLNIFNRDRNKDNLIKVNDSYLESGDNDKGVNWKVSNDGTIKLYGDPNSADNLVIQQVELEAGEYTYSVGNDKVNKDQFYSYVLYNGVERIAGTDSATFEVTETATVDVIIVWTEDADFGSIVGTKIQPVLVKGDDVGSFYEK